MSHFAKTRRQQVVELLEQLIADGTSRTQSELVYFAGQIGTKAYFQILDDIIARSEGPERILACQMVLTSDNRPIPQQQALHTLRQLAEQGPDEERLLAIHSLVETGNVHKELVPSLVSLQERLEEDDHRRVQIAAAIYQALGWNDQGELADFRNQAIKQLLAAFESSELMTQLIAAKALQHAQLYTGPIRESLLKSCEKSSGRERGLLVAYLGKIVGAEENVAEEVIRERDEVVKALTSFAQQEHYDVETRTAAIHALGQTPQDRTDVGKVLTDLTQDADWNVALAAITRLSVRQESLSPAVADRLISSVSHPSPVVRSLSAAMLADHPEMATDLYPHLVRQLAVEETQQAGEAILKALGRGGQAALSAVVAAMEQAEPHQLPIFQSAMLEIAEHSVHEVTQLLTSPNDYVRRSAFGVLQTRGPLAKPIVPVLDQLLDSEDRETVQNALILLSSIGPASLDCFEKLVPLLQSSDQDIRVLTQAVLWKIGPVCTAPLRKVRRKFPEWERDTIDECLRLLAHAYESEDLLLAGVDGVTDENALELFCLVAEILVERGNMAFRKIGAELEQQAGKSFRSDLPCSASQIRSTIEKLEVQWSNVWGFPIRLIDREGTQSGGLNEEMGYRYFQQAQKYLERLRIVRGK